MTKWVTVLSVLLTAACIDSPISRTQTNSIDCSDECTEGETKCEEDETSGTAMFYECVRADATEETSACTSWDVTSCGLGRVCKPADGCECETSCEIGEINCEDDVDNPQRCIEVDGCRSWVSDCAVATDCEADGRVPVTACDGMSSVCKMCSSE